MRRSPPVHLIVQPQWRLRILVLLLAALAGSALATAVLAHWPAAWMVLAVPALAVGWAWHASAPSSPLLRWDGEAWWLAAALGAPEAAVRVVVLIDLERWLLLRTQPVGALAWDWRGRCYIPVARASQVDGWGALRATLYAARPASAPATGGV